MLSNRVIVALELRRVTKRFTAGSGSCVAWAHVLRDVSLTVATGESLALLGSRGAGKSTLLLCAAGLLPHEGGDVRWFGQQERAVAARRASYHCVPDDLPTRAHIDEPCLHLVDIPIEAGANPRVARWIERRRVAGDAVIVSTRDEDLAYHLADRVVVLRDGRLHPGSRPRSRVAECAHPQSDDGAPAGFVDRSLGDI